MCRPIFSREEETVGEADLSRRKRVTTRLSFFYTGGQFSFLEHRGHDIPSRVYNCIKNFTLMLCSSNHSYEKKKKKMQVLLDLFILPSFVQPASGRTHPLSSGHSGDPPKRLCHFIHVQSRFTLLRTSSPRATKEQSIANLLSSKMVCRKKKKHELRGVQIIKQSGYSVQYSSLSRMFLFVCFYSKWLP